MAKQKVKQPGKLSSPGDGAATPGDASPTAIAPTKTRGKRKARLSIVAVPGRKGGAAKRVGKAKLKSSRKRALPKGEGLTAGVVPDAAAARSEPLLASVIGALVKRPAHRIARRQVRLGPIERLEFAVSEVRHGARISPRTRKLQLSGVPKMAQKVVEEAAELAIEAVQGNRLALINESVDLVYNLVVLLAEAGVPLAAIWAEMERRELLLGMAEKLPKAIDHEA